MKTLLGMIGWMAAALTLGQNFTEIRSNVSGTGDLRINNETLRLTEAQVSLDRNSNFSLTLKSDRRTLHFTGTWIRTSHVGARLTIKGGTMRDARGTGDVLLNTDWSVSSVNLNGSGTEGSFLGTFRANRGGSSGPPLIGGVLDQTKNGAGTLRFADSRERERLSRARVVLTRNGDFEINVSGRNSWRYRGTWRYGNDSDIRLTFANRQGSGILHTDFRGGFSSFELAGRVDGRSFSVDFRADGSGGGWELIETVRGNGRIDGPGDEDYNLHRARINLYRNGTFEIILESNRSHTYLGRWKDSGSQIDLILTNVSGAGNLVTNRKSVSRFAFTYLEAGKRFNVSFQAGR